MKLDEHSIPKPLPSASDVEVDGERVVLDRVSGSLHVLNDAGAAIWSHLDGSRSVGTIVSELSEAYQAEPDRVAHDVHEFLVELAHRGLLEPIDGAEGEQPSERPRESTEQVPWTVETAWVDWYTAQVVDALREREIESILLKGPAIKRWLYADSPERRGYLDADLLVADDALAAAAAALSELGFARDDEAERKSISAWAESWRRATDGAAVDLHHTIQGCEHSAVEPWPVLRASAIEDQVGGTTVLLPSLPARALGIVLVSPADRPWRKWEDLTRAITRLSDDDWRAAAEVAADLGVQRKFANRLSQAPGGPAIAGRIGLPTAPAWWLRWETDPLLAWAALLAEVPDWRGRLSLAKELVRPPSGYSLRRWALHIVRLIPGALTTLVRRRGR